MMYKLRFDRAHYLACEIWPDEIAGKLGSPFVLNQSEYWADVWTPLNIRFHDLSDRKNVTTPPDITLWFTDEIVCNAKAYGVLKDALEPYGEWLPVTCEGVEYWLLHVTKKTGMDAVDQEKSTRTIDEADFIDMQTLVFKEDNIKDLLLFKTEYSKYRNIYCGDAFKALIEDAGLNGLIFSNDLVSIM